MFMFKTGRQEKGRSRRAIRHHHEGHHPTQPDGEPVDPAGNFPHPWCFRPVSDPGHDVYGGRTEVDRCNGGDKCFGDTPTAGVQPTLGPPPWSKAGHQAGDVDYPSRGVPICDRGRLGGLWWSMRATRQRSKVKKEKKGGGPDTTPASRPEDVIGMGEERDHPVQTAVPTTTTVGYHLPFTSSMRTSFIRKIVCLIVMNS